MQTFKQNIDTETIQPNRPASTVAEPKPKGRPPLKPTDAQKEMARQMAGRGIPQKRIAKSLGIAPSTLHKHFHPQLKAGVALWARYRTLPRFKVELINGMRVVVFQPPKTTRRRTCVTLPSDRIQ